MLCASTKIHARFASLLTPKWMLIGIYQFTSSPDEAETLALLESLRVEAFSEKPAAAAATATASTADGAAAHAP
jgi:hypothetical protein